MAHSRIDDLRRRVESDPASIAFAQLAEEYRRAGQTEEAVRVSREGLTRHPGYLSARVTLGRALLDLGQLNDARTELQFVATEAPENLAAVRGLAEIFHREGDAVAALEYFQRALALARHDPELEEIVQQLSRQVGAEAGSSNGLSFEEAHQELLSAGDRVPLAPAAATAESAPEVAGDPQATTAPFDFDTLVAALGTPAAPPLVEAVVRGETPEVFELPELPDLPGLPVLTDAVDPFALLEAELRSQPAAEPGPEPSESATDPVQIEPPAEGWLTRAYLADDAPAAAWAATEPDAGGADADPTPLPDVAAGPVPVEAPFAALLTADGDPGDGAEEMTELPALSDLASDAPVDLASDAPVAPAPLDSLAALSETVSVSVSVQEWPAPAVADDATAADATPSDALMAEVAPPVSVDAPLTDAAIDAPPEVPAIAAAPVASEPVAEPRIADPAIDGDRQPAAAGRHDDVLGDLEDWLSTLQERSDQ